MKCRICGSSNFGEVIDLGSMPLVNNLLRTPNDVASRWPLKAVFCKTCSLVQLTHSPPPQHMFDEYLYFSSQSETMVTHASALVDRYVSSGMRVFEIASNDGYLLSHAKRKGANVFGIDPARNIATYASSHGIPTKCNYFTADIAGQIRDEWGSADRIFANNVLAHVPDPHELAAGIAILLAETGAAHIEVPYVRHMIEQCAFDTIYHEHQCYFSVTALERLFRTHNLYLNDIALIPIHGGSLHLQIARKPGNAAAVWIAAEREQGLFEDDYYSSFSRKVWRLRDELANAISQFETVVGYGAAAKGVVLLNTFGLEANRIPWIVDISPHKHGRFIPGTLQEVVSPDELSRQKPEAALLLAWNIKNEILRRNSAYLDQGGRFIVPIPEVEIVHASRARKMVTL